MIDILLVRLITLCALFANGAPQDVFLFSYFVDNGQDGLHLAYSQDGLTWETLNNGQPLLAPEIGQDKLMRDPCIVQDPNGTFHMVWTTGWWDRHIGIAHSRDLIHWSKQEAIPVMQHEPQARNCWAPELIYDEEKGQYVIFWSTWITGRYPDTDATGHILSSDPNKPRMSHRIYATTTEDFETFSPTFLFFEPGFNVIDATILPYENQFVMFVKDETLLPPAKTIHYTTAGHASGPYATDVSAPITGHYWAEGPSALRVDDYVYVYFDKYRNHRYGAVRSKDLKQWEDASDRVHFPEGVRHGTMFKVSKAIVDRLINLSAH